MWLLTAGLMLTVSAGAAMSQTCQSCQPCQTSQPYTSNEQIHNMELDAFYKDCTVFDDQKLFGGPVCGSDGTTYANCVHMACVNHWRPAQEKVKMVSNGVCVNCDVPFDWSPVYFPVCGDNNLTYANTEALKLYNKRAGQDTQVLYNGECVDPTLGILGIDYTPWEGAVCATNGRTYQSVDAISDLRRLGQCVDVLHDGGCTVEEVKERVRSRAELCDLARNFYEVNPICGEDGMTYGNPYILLCFKPNVKASYMGECDSPLHRACQAAVDIDQGVVTAPGPVCGSDGLTYTSGYHLDCASNNDKYLSILHEGECSVEDNPCTSMPEVTDGGDPICASDGVTYVNSFALWCTQRKEDPFLRFFHDGPCFRRCIECGGCNGFSGAS